MSHGVPYSTAVTSCIQDWVEVANLLTSPANLTVDLTVDKEVTTFRVFYRSTCRCAATHTQCSHRHMHTNTYC